MTTDLDRFRAVAANLTDDTHKNRRYAFIGCVDSDFERFEATLWAAWREGLVDIRGDFFFWQHLANRPDDYTVEDLAGVYRQLAPTLVHFSRHSSAIAGWHGELDRLLWPRLDDAEALLPLLTTLTGPFRDALAYALVRHGLQPATILPDDMRERVAHALSWTVGRGNGFRNWQNVWPLETFAPFVMARWFAEEKPPCNHLEALTECVRHDTAEVRLKFLRKVSFFSDNPWMYQLSADSASELAAPFSTDLDAALESTWHRATTSGIQLIAACRSGAVPPRWDPLLREALGSEGDAGQIRLHIYSLLMSLPESRRQAVMADTGGEHPWRGVAACPTPTTAAAVFSALLSGDELKIDDARIEAIAAIWPHLPGLLRGRKGALCRWLRAFFSPSRSFRGLSGTRDPQTPGLTRWKTALSEATRDGVLATVQHLQAHWNDFRNPFDLPVPLGDQMVGVALWVGLFTRTGQGYRSPSCLSNLFGRLSGADRDGLAVALEEAAWLAKGPYGAQTFARELEGAMKGHWPTHAVRMLADRPPKPAKYVDLLLDRPLVGVLVPLAIHALGSEDADLRLKAGKALASLGSDHPEVLRSRLGESPINIGIAELLSRHPSADNIAPARAALRSSPSDASERALLILLIDSLPVDPDATPAALRARLVALDPGPVLAAPALKWHDGTVLSAGESRWISAAVYLESDVRHHPGLSVLCQRLHPESRARLLVRYDTDFARAILSETDGIAAWCAELDVVTGSRQKKRNRALEALRRSPHGVAARWLDRWARTGRSDALRLAAHSAIQDVPDARIEAVLPRHDFADDGTRTLSSCTLHLEPGGALTVATPGQSRRRKTAPAADRAVFKAVKKALTADITDQTRRLERALMTGRIWRGADLSRLLRHPIHRSLLTGLVVQSGDTLLALPADLSPDQDYQLAHPAALPPGRLDTVAGVGGVLSQHTRAVYRHADGDPLGALLSDTHTRDQRPLIRDRRLLGFRPLQDEYWVQGGVLRLPGGLTLTIKHTQHTVNLRYSSDRDLSLTAVAIHRNGVACDPAELPPTLYSETVWMLRSLMGVG